MIGTLPRGVGSVLDAADLDPFWAAADETGALIHIHPSFDAGDVRVNDFGLANGARPHHRRGGGGGAADLGRAYREIQECEIFRADGRGRPALRARPAQAQCRDHARRRRSGRGAGRASIPTPSCTMRAC